MKKAILQKTAVSIITVAMLASPVSALADTGNFPDMPNDWSTDALNHAVKSGLLYGIDGKIEPNMKLTKAQLAAIMVRAFGSSGTADISKYTDVISDAWYSDSVAKAIYMGILSGSDGKINPDKNVTRQEAAVVLALAFGLEPAPEYVEGFSDSADVADWAKGAVGALVKAGYMKGADGKLLPNKELTRAEFAQIMYTAVQLYITQPGTYTSIPEGNVLIASPDVTLSGVNVTGSLIIGNGVGDGTVYIKDSNINNINKRLDESNISYLDEENTDNNNVEPSKNNNSRGSGSSGGGSHSRPSTQKAPPSLKEEPGKQSDGKGFGLYPTAGDYYIAMFSTADHDDNYKNEVAYVDNIASVIVGGVKYTRTNDINKIINGEEKLFYVDSENCGVIISGGEDFDGNPDEKVKVIITSKGYKNVDFELSKEDKNIIHTPPAYTKIAKLTGTSLETQDYIYKIDFDNASDYLGKITDIWVNGIRIPPLTYIENFEPLADTMQYYFVDAENSCLYISSGELSGYTLVGADVQIVADGYEDYKFVFNVESNLKAAPEPAEVPGKLSEGKGFGFYNKPTGSDFDYYIAMFLRPDT